RDVGGIRSSLSKSLREKCHSQFQCRAWLIPLTPALSPRGEGVGSVLLPVTRPEERSRSAPFSSSFKLQACSCSSPYLRNLQQVLQVIENRLAVGFGVVAQHQIAVGIDDPQLRSGRCFGVRRIGSGI